MMFLYEHEAPLVALRAFVGSDEITTRVIVESYVEHFGDEPAVLLHVWSNGQRLVTVELHPDDAAVLAQKLAGAS
jgi:23S rRNA A2030 N6-methylase RlmJ